MNRVIKYTTVLIAFAVITTGTYYFGNQYWIHRYDQLIVRHAKVYRIESRLVWSVIYEETYFRATIVGEAKEVGLMQVTPTVAREWAKATGLKEFEKKTADNVRLLLSDPEKNIQVGCWYLEQLREKYRDLPAQDAMTLSAYNAGPSRVEEWLKNVDRTDITEQEFVELIGISSTKLYVKSILKRFRENK
jgi:soluble lytic murein transglycosylase